MNDKPRLMKYLAEKRERMRVSIENTVEICNTWRYVHLRKTERGRERERWLHRESRRAEGY